MHGLDRPAKSHFFSQPLRPHLIGTTRALSCFCSTILQFLPFAKGSNMFAVSALQGDSLQTTRGRRKGGLSAEAHRLELRQPTGPFSRRASSRFCTSTFSATFSSAPTWSTSSSQTRGETTFARSSSSALCPSSAPQDRVSLDRFSILPASFFHGFLESSDLVNEFPGNVRRKDFCTMLVVCSWSFTQDLISLDGSSNCC